MSLGVAAGHRSPLRRSARCHIGSARVARKWEKPDHGRASDTYAEVPVQKSQFFDPIVDFSPTCSFSFFTPLKLLHGSKSCNRASVPGAATLMQILRANLVCVRN